MFRHRERDDEIKPSTGLMKWINKFFRFILYPFIHPKAFAVLVVLLAIIVLCVPYFVYNVQFADMPNWYKMQFNKYYNDGKEALLPIKDKAVMKYNKMLRGEAYKAANINSKNQNDIEKYDIKPQGKRDNFIAEFTNDEKVIEIKEGVVADNVDDEIKADVNEEIKDGVKEVGQRIADVTPSVDELKSKTQVYFKRDDRLNLTYVAEPEKVTGRFTVINSNEALIGNREVFLYGIYTDTKDNKAQEAGAYMMDNFDGKQADCYIGAYTENNIATAICFVDGVSVNHALVEKGWAQNVSLY